MTILSSLRTQLHTMADAKLRESGKRFFKEPVKSYGTKTADVSALAKKFFKKIQDMPKAEVFHLCEELWKSGYMEESFIACEWAYSMRKHYTKEDFEVFERWVHTYVTNWASCDTFCNHSVGTFIEMYPTYVHHLKTWTTSRNMWVRRAAAVTLIVPAKKGLFLNDILAIADLLLNDPEDLVQKGYGWMLKAASQAHQKEIFEYVMKKKAVMPRTALRYAIEKMPKHLKTEAMEK